MKKSLLSLAILGCVGGYSTTLSAQNTVGSTTLDPNVLFTVDNAATALPQAMRITGLPAASTPIVNVIAIDASGNLGTVSTSSIGGSNLATDNLTQDAEDRTYDVNGQTLSFTGSTTDTEVDSEGRLFVRDQADPNRYVRLRAGVVGVFSDTAGAATELYSTQIQMGRSDTEDKMVRFMSTSNGVQGEIRQRMSNSRMEFSNGQGGGFMWNTPGTSDRNEMVILNSGRVGIRNDAPTSQLAVGGLTDGGAQPRVITSDVAGNFYYADSSDFSGGGSSMNLATDNLTQDAQTRTYNTNGKFLLVTGTANTAVFEADGDFRVQTQADGTIGTTVRHNQFVINDGTSQAQLLGNQLRLGRNNTTNKMLRFQAADGSIEGEIRQDTNGSMVFNNDMTGGYVWDAAGTATGTDMAFTNGGRLGVGTAAPDRDFEVTDSDGGGTAYIRVSEGNSFAEFDPTTFALGRNSAGQNKWIRFYDGNNGNIGGSIQYTESSGDFSFGKSLGNGSMIFNHAGEVGNEIEITSNGRVGILTSSPNQQLSVNGNASKSGGGSWSTFSDKRVKENIQSYDDGLAELMKIEPVTFKYNGKGPFKSTGKTEVGIIAQDLQEIAPYMIEIVPAKLNKDDAKDTDLLMYNDSALTYMLVNAVQDLKTQQDEKVATLEAENNALKEQLASVKANMGKLEVLEASLKALEERLGSTPLVQAKLKVAK